MKSNRIAALIVIGYAVLIAWIGLHVSESSATKAAIESQLSAGFSGLTGAVSPTLAWSKTATAIHNGVVVGSSTNDSAASGEIGESVSSAVSQASSVSLTSAVSANVTSISLSAGDWDVSGIVSYAAGSGYVGSFISASVGTVSATAGTQGDNRVDMSACPIFSVADASAIIPVHRLSLASTTTVYLVAQAGLSAGSLKAYGRISARRMR